jgi:hypothetical protein
MDLALVSALSALAGTALGGLTSGLTTMLNTRVQVRSEQIAHSIARREDLVRDFIIEAAKTYGDAIVSNEPKTQDLVNLYAMVSRMRVLSMPRSAICADKVLRTTLDTYFQPNRTLSDLNKEMKDGSSARIDVLREFGELAREEIGVISFS